MRKNLTVAILCATWLSAAIAFADDGKATAQAKAERVKLLKVIAELKAQVAKHRDLADQQRARAEDEKARAVAQLKRAEAEKRSQRFVADRKARIVTQTKRAEYEIRLQRLGPDKRALLEKRRVLILRTTNGGKPRSPKGHAGGQQLEHLLAALKHLRAAGQKELANAVAQRVERLQAELKKGLVKGGGKGSIKRNVKGGGKNRQGKGANYKEIWAKLQALVKAGKLTAEQANAKMAAIKNAAQLKGGKGPKGDEGKGGKGRFKSGGKNRQGKGNIDGNLRELSQAIRQLRKQMQGLQKSVEQLQKRRK